MRSGRGAKVVLPKKKKKKNQTDANPEQEHCNVALIGNGLINEASKIGTTVGTITMSVCTGAPFDTFR
jgi:hypothetical protein